MTTILLTESDIDTTVPLFLPLQDHGFRALHATDGGWALRLACAARPDLILLAVDLPRLDGLAVCRVLREESAVPILLLVAAEREQGRVRSGATHFESASHLTGALPLPRAVGPRPGGAAPPGVEQ